MRDAVGFLTVIPVRAGPLRPRSVALFPAVGALIGIGWVLAAGVGHWLGGPLVAAALVLAVDLLLTGGLHLDGLADTADGLASGRPPDQARQVMKDPRIGAVGAAALGTVLLLRFALLASLIGTIPSSLAGWLTLATVPVVGRCALVFLLPDRHRRPDSLAAGPAGTTPWWVQFTAALVTAGLVAVAAGPTAVPVAALAVGFAVVVAARWWRRRLGSSGDVIGAGGIVAEMSMLLGLCGLATISW